MHAGDDRVEQRQRANGQGPAPAPVTGVRDDEVANHGGDDPADGPEGFQQHGHTATLLGRREFGHQCGGNRQLSTKAQSDDQSSAEQHAERPGQAHGAVGDTENDQRGGEHGFASHTVGDESAESRTDGHANEANGEYP